MNAKNKNIKRFSLKTIVDSDRLLYIRYSIFRYVLYMYVIPLVTDNQKSLNRW